MSTRERRAKGAIHVQAVEGQCMLENAKEIVSKIKGVFDVEANHVTHMLAVEYDSSRVTLDQIRRTIEAGR